MKLRPYQTDVKEQVLTRWQVSNNLGVVLPTGAGKTVLLSDIVRTLDVPTCCIAHRQELVGQISLALAKQNIYHNIIAAKNTVKTIARTHLSELGTSFYDPSSPTAVAGVDTLVKRDLGPWAEQVGLVVQDECHHILQGNKWGSAMQLFPNAKLLGVTATPCRADGKGLGSHTDGLLDELIIGPTMRDLINQKYLCEYSIYAPTTSDLDLETVTVSTATGDYSKTQLQQAIDKSHIVGDVVDNYLKFAHGKRGVTFTTSVDTASKISAEYNSKGVPSEVVSAKTPDATRAAIIARFAKGDLLNLVNVDLFGEGFDLPAIEVVSFARPTQSYALYVQQFGRALRPLPGKEKAIIIDHVNNVIRHGLPDAAKEWSLERRAKRAKRKPGDDIPLTTCDKCTRPYERTHNQCPYCDHKSEPLSREEPKYVDGDLTELTPEVLARMRGDADRLVGPAFSPNHLSAPAKIAATNHHEKRKRAQFALRASLSMWLGYQKSFGHTLSASYRIFWFQFGIDMMSAQALTNYKDTINLANRVNLDIGVNHSRYKGIQ